MRVYSVPYHTFQPKILLSSAHNRDDCCCTFTLTLSHEPLLTCVELEQNWILEDTPPLHSNLSHHNLPGFPETKCSSTFHNSIHQCACFIHLLFQSQCPFLKILENTQRALREHLRSVRTSTGCHISCWTSEICFRRCKILN